MLIICFCGIFSIFSNTNENTFMNVIFFLFNVHLSDIFYFSTIQTKFAAFGALRSMTDHKYIHDGYLWSFHFYSTNQIYPDIFLIHRTQLLSENIRWSIAFFVRSRGQGSEAHFFTDSTESTLTFSARSSRRIITS